MSVKSVMAFFEKVEEDEGLQRKLKSLTEKYKAPIDPVISELVIIASEAGYDFTAEDCINARSQVAEKVSGSELKQVVSAGNCPGGAGYQCGILIRF